MQIKEEPSIVFVEENEHDPQQQQQQQQRIINFLNNTTTTEPAAIVNPDGFVVRRVMDADNSCLFNSIGYCMKHSGSHSKVLRKKIVHDTVLNDPRTVIRRSCIKKPIDEYAEWISKDASWGGQIELTILVKHYVLK